MTNTQLLKSYVPNPIDVKSINILSVFLEMIEGEDNETLALKETVQKVCLWLTEDIYSDLSFYVDWDNFIVSKHKSSILSQDHKHSISSYLEDLTEIKKHRNLKSIRDWSEGHSLGVISYCSFPTGVFDRLMILREKIINPIKRKLP